MCGCSEVRARQEALLPHSQGSSRDESEQPAPEGVCRDQDAGQCEESHVEAVEGPSYVACRSLAEVRRSYTDGKEAAAFGALD